MRIDLKCKDTKELLLFCQIKKRHVIYETWNTAFAVCLINTLDLSLCSFPRPSTNHLSPPLRAMCSISLKLSLSLNQTRPLQEELDSPITCAPGILPETELEETLEKARETLENEFQNEDGRVAFDPFKIITSQALVCFDFYSFCFESILSFFCILFWSLKSDSFGYWCFVSWIVMPCLAVEREWENNGKP